MGRGNGSSVEVWQRKAWQQRMGQLARRGTGRIAAAVVAAVSLATPLGLVTDAAAQDPVVPEPDITAAAVPVRLAWTRPVPQHVSTSSPVLVSEVASPFVVAGDTAGNLRAFDLQSGAPVAGWGAASTGFVMRAPLSSDGTNVYAPVGQDGKDRYPRYRKYSASGARLWDSNPSTALPAQATGGFLLSGLSLARVGSAWRGVGGSSGHWVYGVDAANGAKAWEFRNADSTMATPALADLYGTGTPQVVTSNDTSAEFSHDRHGGILRILTLDGRQICTATQLVSGSTYASSGYNNSSPVVAQIGGEPLIVFGSTGPVQSGAGGNQVVAYDSACRLRWASAPLAAQVQPSPTVADVRGTGGLQVAQVVGVRDGTATYPRVVVLDAATGVVVDDTGTSLRGYGAALAYPPSVQLTTADVDRDGAQDLIVPARQGRFLILDGRTLDVMGEIPTNLVVQNTPVVTEAPDGVRVTFAGYSSTGGVVSSYVLEDAELGARGWTSFGGSPQLTGVQGQVAPAGDQLLEGDSLASGAVLRARSGGATATMQTDGNLVLRRGDGSVRWQSGTSVPGSTLTLGTDGLLVVTAPGGTRVWTSGRLGFGTERLVLGSDGVLKVWTGFWTATRRLTTTTAVWSSSGIPTSDRLQRGQVLAPGASLVSKDRRFTVTMQTDGNLVLRQGGTVRWQSATRDPSRRAYARLGADGNLIVVGDGDRLLFSAGVAGRGGVLAVVQSDGLFRVASSTGGTIWGSGPVK